MGDVWLEVFTRYQKDPGLIAEWLRVVESDLGGAVERARSLVVPEAVPDTVTLGFSPQILFALAVLRWGEGLKVITSPEVAEGSVPPARFSHELLSLLRREGVVKEVVTAPMAPSPSVPPSEVVSRVRAAIEGVGPEILDISGGTQLAAIAAAESGARLTYTYPLGDVVHVFVVRG